MSEQWYLGTMNDALFIIDKPPSPAPDDTGPWNNLDGPNPISAAIDDHNGELIVKAHNTSVAALRDENERLLALLKEGVGIARRPFVYAETRMKGIFNQPYNDAIKALAQIDDALKKGRGEGSLAPGSTASIEQEEWRTIETAPLDQDLILGWRQDWPKPEWRQTISWAGKSNTKPPGMSNAWRDGQATHWRPLPAPPAEW
jgi:hypothetical protein